VTWRIALPPFAEIYLKGSTRRHTKRVVVLFHGWLDRTGRSLAAVGAQDLEAFSSGPKGRPVAQMTRNNYRYELRLYLRWLERWGLAGPFEPHELEGYHRKPLPDEVRRFLRFLAPTRRPGTVDIYRSALRRFHAWLDARKEDGPPGAHQIGAAAGRTPLAIDRSVCLGWAQQLHAEGLHPATRVGMLVCLRKYLDWLYDQHLVATPGPDLIVVGDLPKKPEYLPRPLPPEADLKLQARLRGERSHVALGLYVMRRTGLRIGELRRLERDCLREDHAGNTFLKVPLGKLQKERLVPLDPSALATIRALQERPQKSPWLIEGARGHPVSAETFQSMLVRLGADLELHEPLVTHRLRHTYATSLINGGMSLPGIMKLLGHRDQRMTLRYTQIADETVGREYFEALARIAERYQLPQATAAVQAPPDAVALLEDAIRWITKNLCGGDLERQARLLIRRLEAARKEVVSLSALDDR
jgi:site-specific recombinase XerD